MKLFSVFILFTALGACSQIQNTKKHIPDPKARILYDSAVTLAMQSANNYIKAISLLDQATQIDSNYSLAFSIKLSFQFSLNRLNDALITAKNLIRINPNNPESYVMTGGIYWKLEDSVSSIDHFTKAAVLFDKILDTMSTSNKTYETVLMNKAVNLILLDQQEKGNKILNELYSKQKDEAEKDMFRLFLNKSKNQILNDLFMIDSDVTQAESIKN